jgi:hypothetical protein
MGQDDHIRHTSEVSMAEYAEEAEAEAEAAVGADMTQDESGPDSGESGKDKSKVLETIALVLLSVTAILTAWCGFESSKWGGEMSIAFSRASTTRLEAARYQGTANNARQEDLTIYAVFVQAVATNDERLASYVRDRFTPWFKVAFEAWTADGRKANSPFAMPEYVPPGSKESRAADQRADSLFAQALVNNQRGDNYTLLTVLAALVLFFAAISTRLNRRPLQWAALGLAIVLFIVGGSIALSLPIIV